MEYCEKKSLDDYLKSRKTLSEYETRYYMFQVLEALKYLRRQKVIHRDLTLANIFLKDYKTVKIGDFGLSYKETENEEKQGLMCGTQGYFTPESYTTKYSYKTDIFDFGVCIYHLMTGTTLFKDSLSSYEAVKKGEIVYDDKTKFSSEVKDLFKKIFVVENQRIDLDKIFQHPFFNEGSGLVNVDFPDFFTVPKKDFDEKIKKLEQGVIMTNICPYPRKNTLNKEESYPTFVTKKSFNELGENKSREYGLNESIKNNALASNKRLIQLNKNKISLNAEASDNSDKDLINGEKKRLRASIKNKKNIEDEQSEKEGNSKKKQKKVTLIVSDDKKDKEEKDKNNSDEFNKSDEKEVNLRDKLENLKMLNNNNQENKDSSEGLNVFKLRQSTKSLDMGFKANKDISSGKLSFKDVNENEVENTTKIKNKVEPVYIQEIIEINEKYGIAYILSNKDIGILFKDSSHITKFKKIKNLIYYTKDNYQKKILLPLNDEGDQDLQKKICYLGYIIDEIKKRKLKNKKIDKKEDEKNNDNNNNSFNSKTKKEKRAQRMNKDDIYLEKYKKNKYAYFFILSNKTIQIDFFEGTKVVFIYSPLSKKIIYVHKEGNITNFELGLEEDFSNFKCDDIKINKRIKYAIREIKK